MNMLKAIYIKNCIKRYKESRRLGSKMSRSLNTRMKRQSIKGGV